MGRVLLLALAFAAMGVGADASEFCSYRHLAPSDEDRLIDAVAHSSSPDEVRESALSLGCLHSTKALPKLAAMLRSPDWQTNEAAAKAIGAIGTAPPDAVAALEYLRQTHWSLLVRLAAEDALVRLGAFRTRWQRIGKGSGIETIVIGGLTYFDHGLPACDDAKRYSVDGRYWFKLRWHHSKMEPPPKGFPKTHHLMQGYGSQTFLRVDNGWLFGSIGFELEGKFVHVSDRGVVTMLDDAEAGINSIFRLKSRIFAFGFELLKDGDAGALYEIKRGRGGKWHAERIVQTPSAAFGYAIAPGGVIVMSDLSNAFAIRGTEIVPLQCGK